jgi:hypothetical protein
MTVHSSDTEEVEKSPRTGRVDHSDFAAIAQVTKLNPMTEDESNPLIALAQEGERARLLLILSHTKFIMDVIELHEAFAATCLSIFKSSYCY